MTSRNPSVSVRGMERTNLDRVRRALEPVLRRVLHFYWRFARAMTLGVRAMVID